ncbi:MAG TPA: hypothetical protein PLO89_00345 [Spirochaetota bacterium]|nr:hypothetical protein [Spirochaetota bacterium]
MKKIFIIFLAVFIYLNLFAEEESNEKVIIGITPPFMRNKNVGSIFLNRQFIFEFLSNFSENRYTAEILTPDFSENEKDYLRNCIETGVKFQADYIVTSKVYSIEDTLFFEFNLLNPYNNSISISKLFSKSGMENLGDFLYEISESLSRIINEKELKKIKNKTINLKKNTGDKTDRVVEDKTFYKHEVFVMNGFFKNNPKVMSFLSLYTGYNFTPFNFFCVEGGIFIGGGYKENDFSFDKMNLKVFYVGGYGSFGFFIPGIVQPSINLRFEFSYIFQDIVSFSIPVDLGIKIFINKEHAIRINSSFQFNYLNLFNVLWEKNFIIGVMVGYAKKI